MRIAGLQKLTLLDFPGRMAATVFTPGCNFRCPFCHNASLVVPGGEVFPVIDERDVLEFLEKRRGVLDGVCITGGEPLLQPDIGKFCATLKSMGFAVKIDTNGSFPAVLAGLIEADLVDYVAMDMKAACPDGAGASADGVGTPVVCGGIDEGAADIGKGGIGFDGGAGFAAGLGGVDNATPHGGCDGAQAVCDGIPAAYDLRRFARVLGIDPQCAASLADAVRESAAVLMRGAVPYEFRTTVVRELHDESHLRDIARTICGAQAWYLQGFIDSGDVIGGSGAFHAYASGELRALADAVRPFVLSVQVRGVD